MAIPMLEEIFQSDLFLALPIYRAANAPTSVV
jgi:hypothetical protein